MTQITGPPVQARSCSLDYRMESPASARGYNSDYETPCMGLGGRNSDHGAFPLFWAGLRVMGARFLPLQSQNFLIVQTLTPVTLVGKKQS